MEPSKQHVIVHNMGRVGSHSVYHSLKQAYNKGEVQHVHNLSNKSLNKYKRSLDLGVEGFSLEKYKRFVAIKDYINSYKEHKMKVISLVRNPLDRYISLLYLEFLRGFPGLIPNREVSTLKIISHHHHFFKRLPRYIKDTEGWFSEEFLDVWGVDILSKDFDREKGWSIISTDTVDILILTLESLDYCFPTAVKAFLDIDNLPLINKREANKETYYPYYRVFKNTLSISPILIEMMYSAQYAKHFYTSKRISQFKRQWLDQTRGNRLFRRIDKVLASLMMLKF